MKPDRYRSSTKEAGGRRSEGRTDDEDRGLAGPSATIYHVSPEEAGPAGPRSRADLTPDETAGLAAWERALGIGSGSRPTDEDRGLAETHTGVVTVPPEEGIRMGAQPRRQLPRLTDQSYAAVERSGQIAFDTQHTRHLLHIAVDRNRRLFDRSSPIAPCYRAAMAESLIMIHNILDARVQAAPRDRHGVPILEGLHWDPEDPLERSLEAIPPFSMRDAWEVIYREQSRICRGEQPPPQRRRGPVTTPVVQIYWYTSPTTGETTSPFRRQVVTRRSLVYLDGRGSSDPSGGRLRYQWSFLDHPPYSRTPIRNSRRSQAQFTVDRIGTYVVQLVVTNRFGVSASDRVRITATGRRPLPSEGRGINVQISLDDLQRDLRPLARQGTFAHWFLRNISPLYQPRPNPPRPPSRATTFAPIGRNHIRELERLRDRGTLFTTDESGYLRVQRYQLQRTVNDWHELFNPVLGKIEQGEGRYSFQNWGIWRRFCDFVERTRPERSCSDAASIGGQINFMKGRGGPRPLR